MIYHLLHDTITFLSEPNCDLIVRYREVAVNYILNYVVDVVSNINNLYDSNFWVDRYNNYLDSDVGLEASAFTQVVNIMELTIPGLYYVSKSSKGLTLKDIALSVDMSCAFNDDKYSRVVDDVNRVFRLIEPYKGISKNVNTYEFVDDEGPAISDVDAARIWYGENTDVISAQTDKSDNSEDSEFKEKYESEVNESDKQVEYNEHMIKINVDDKVKLPSKNELNALLDAIAEIVALIENGDDTDAHTSQQMKDMLPLIVRCKRILRR